MSIEERFNAAVNVIRGLPKNGPYQPSNDMLLTFYSLFKQATEGKCNAGRPALWNVVNRAKWDAWNRLGDMPKEVAMQKYVDELKKIVETMSYTDNVANFLEYGNGNDSSDSGVSLNDLEMVAPEAIQKVRSRPNSPIASRDTSPVRSSPVPPQQQQPPLLVNGFHAKPLTNGFHHHYQNGGAGSGTQSDLSDDEYIDTVEDSESESTFRPIVASHVSRSRVVVQNGAAPSSLSLGSEQFHSLGSTGSTTVTNPEVAAQLARAIERLNASVQQVNQRINVVEQSVASLRAAQSQVATVKHVQRNNDNANYPPWWPFEDISPRLLALVILWPLVVGRMTAWLQQRRK
uniref:Putative acyl-coa-binding domain-containing protein 5 n=1 Tax=Culex tarsalis TaxID=7177 RepID=A0A1Q3FFR1_CULTA